MFLRIDAGTETASVLALKLLRTFAQVGDGRVVRWSAAG
jgi:hypothetical protein